MENQFCQSCGMPLDVPELHGTGNDGLPVEDYCVYCYKNGEFTQDVTMEQMIQLCALYANGSDRVMAIRGMRKKYPALKRWAQKEATQHEYYKLINKVLDYIQKHLLNKPDLTQLAEIANLSTYHFQRIFKAVVGENLGEYVKRLRLEYVAEQLSQTDLSIADLAERTSYSSEQALSRAFKKYFGIPPKVYKNSVLETRRKLDPRICKLSDKYVIFLRETEKKESEDVRWKRLYVYAMVHRLLDESTESLEINVNRDILNPIFYPCITSKELLGENESVFSKTIGGGLFAIFTHKGAYRDLLHLYHLIWEYWLPQSKYKLRESSFCYVNFLNSPSEVEEQNLLSEIYIPLVE